MYGTHDLPFHYETEDFSLSFEHEEGRYLYHRELCGEKKEHILLSSGGRVIINPVEPLNLPKSICHALLVEFDPLSIEPGARATVYLTFPIEIGVFVAGRGNLEVLDIFSWNAPKYTLYGSSDAGTIARYWKSATCAAPPDLDPFREGLLSLTISNTTRDWIELSRTVLESTGMKIYYDDTQVSMQARMRLVSTMVAETSFRDRPFAEGQKKALELCQGRAIPGVERLRFLMDQGL
ncbi:DUF432 domain-containing protein [Methanofollis aquaemaris]|uniref:DUF432 domain-containing protein n=1 Tax=Methanofollis aquaemaris TaxID=126734 RepID=A0A8A3S754_9EURY|nr:DUF432 domain-containing protein [Methanofollis aquaemaris]QSZ67494.1 DUF432 domain-containing protein [Methanofollis aquaemaris]